MSGRLTNRVKSSGAGSLLVAMLCLGALLLGINLLSSSQAFGADAGLTRVEQTDTRLAYAGSWSTFSTASASGGSYKQANTSATSLVIPFNGTWLDWIATKDVNMGKADVSVDGKAPVTVDLAAASAAYQQRVFSTGVLASGYHTVKISWNAGNIESKYINLDAVEVVGSLLAKTRVQQTDTRIAYSGTWSTFSVASASGGSYARANTSRASATISFSGVRLDWIATKGTTLGKALVSFDGKAPVSVNLANSTVLRQQTVWSSGFVAPGSAYRQDRWDPTNLAGKYISLDAVDVTGILPGGTSTASATTTTTVAPIQSTGKTYYVDAANGNDSNNGTSTATPWKTLSQVRTRGQSTPYLAGERILLKRGTCSRIRAGDQLWAEPTVAPLILS